MKNKRRWLDAAHPFPQIPAKVTLHVATPAAVIQRVSAENDWTRAMRSPGNESARKVPRGKSARGETNPPCKKALLEKSPCIVCRQLAKHMHLREGRSQVCRSPHSTAVKRNRRAPAVNVVHAIRTDALPQRASAPSPLRGASSPDGHLPSGHPSSRQLRLVVHLYP